VPFLKVDNSPLELFDCMTSHPMTMTEVSERFEFDNPYRNIKPRKLKKVLIEPLSLAEVKKICKYVREGYRHCY